MSKRGKPRPDRRSSFFGLHFDLHPTGGDRELGRLVTPAMIRRIIRVARPDYLQYDCKGHIGFLGYRNAKTGPVAGGPGGRGIVSDSLAIYRKITAEAGVALYVHFSGLWDELACQEHPEWAAIEADGKRSGRYTSTFGPYVRERMIPQMKEIVDRYDVDGFWIDGECWALAPDYCDAAKRRFRELTGHAEPPKTMDEPRWSEWMAVQREQFTRFVQEYVDAMHQYKPGLQITSNWMYTPMYPDPVEVDLDYVSGDYVLSDASNAARVHARYMANVGLPWDLMAWAFAAHQEAGSIYKTAPQLQREAAVVLSQGGGFETYFMPDRHGGFAEFHIDLMREVSEFCQKRRSICFQSESIPQVAVLYDATTPRNSCAIVNAIYGRGYSAMRGMVHAILGAGHSVDIVADHQLLGQLDRFPLVAVPEWDGLKPEMIGQLIHYVRRGGSLLVVGGKMARLFADVLGVRVGRFSDADAFVHVPRSTSVELAGVVRVKGPWLDVEPARGTRVLAWRTPGMYEREGRAPAATITRVGKGQVAAVYGSLGQAHFDAHSPWSRGLFGSMLDRLYKPIVRISGSHQVDMALRRKDRKLAVHLVNVAAMTAAANGRYPLIDKIPPIGPITVDIRLARRPRRVRLEPEGRTLRCRWTANTVTVTVPRLEIHQALVIE